MSTFGVHYRTGSPGQLGLRVAGFPGHWVTKCDPVPSLLPARRPAANPPHATTAVDRRDRWTDRRTDNGPLHRPCSARSMSKIPIIKYYADFYSTQIDERSTVSSVSVCLSVFPTRSPDMYPIQCSLLLQLFLTKSKYEFVLCLDTVGGG